MELKEMIEDVKTDLQNINTINDIKHNPVVTTFVSSLKSVPFIGDLINVCFDRLPE